MDTRLDAALRLLELAQQTQNRSEAMHLIATARHMYPISKETISRIWLGIVPADAHNQAVYRNLRDQRERFETRTTLLNAGL